MRIGVSAVLKLVKLIPAISSMMNAMAISAFTVLRLAFGRPSNMPAERKWSSGSGSKISWSWLSSQSVVSNRYSALFFLKSSSIPSADAGSSSFRKQ